MSNRRRAANKQQAAGRQQRVWKRRGDTKRVATANRIQKTLKGCLMVRGLVIDGLLFGMVGAGRRLRGGRLNSLYQNASAEPGRWMASLVPSPSLVLSPDPSKCLQPSQPGTAIPWSAGFGRGETANHSPLNLTDPTFPPNFRGGMPT